MATQQGNLKLDIPGLIAPWLIGSIVASGAFGVLIVQVVYYYLRHPEDYRFNKVLVFLLTVISAASWGIAFYIIWYLTITARSNDFNLVRVTYIIYLPFMLSGISALFNQWFFALRSFELYNRSKPLGIIFGLLILGTFGIGIAGGNVNSKAPGFVLNATVLDWVDDIPGMRKAYFRGLKFNEAYLFACSATNLIITGALVWKVARIPRGFRSASDKLIVRILALSLSTAFISTLFELVSAILLITTINKNEAAFSFLLQLPHVYALVTIGSLNSRHIMDPRATRQNQRRDNHHQEPRSLSTGYYDTSSGSSGRGQEGNGNEVRVGPLSNAVIGDVGGIIDGKTIPIEELKKKSSSSKFGFGSGLFGTGGGGGSSGGNERSSGGSRNSRGGGGGRGRKFQNESRNDYETTMDSSIATDSQAGSQFRAFSSKYAAGKGMEEPPDLFPPPPLSTLSIPPPTSGYSPYGGLSSPSRSNNPNLSESSPISAVIGTEKDSKQFISSKPSLSSNEILTTPTQPKYETDSDSPGVGFGFTKLPPPSQQHHHHSSVPPSPNSSPTVFAVGSAVERNPSLIISKGGHLPEGHHGSGVGVTREGTHSRRTSTAYPQ